MSEAIIDSQDVKQAGDEIMLAINKQFVVNPEDTPYDIRKKIVMLGFCIKKYIATYDLPEINPPVEHIFTDGMYIRKWFGPVGTLTIGKLHKKAHILILLKGECTIVTEATGVNYHIAPAIIEYPAGLQKVVLAHTDIVLCTVHITDCKDADKIVEEVTARNYAEVGKKDPIINEQVLLDLYEQGLDI